MRQSFLSCFALLAVLFLSAGLLSAPGAEAAGAEPSAPVQTESSAPAGWDAAQTVTVLTAEGSCQMPLSDYLWGVLAAEMPASFPDEALKAQAVAARTNVLYRLAHPSDAHPDAQVCTDYHCCQAYLTKAEAAANWGGDAETHTARIAAAVAETDGVRICYEGEPIQALFFSSAAGHTLASDEVWSASIPYLQPVASPEDETLVPNYHSVVPVSAEEFRAVFLAAHPDADLSGAPAGWVGDQTYTTAGVLQTLCIGGVTVKATEVRSLFSLRSAVFTLSAQEDGMTFYVTGYGHGVGMSQYGAKVLAEQGESYRDILMWYYSGVTVAAAET